jgi:hypothetical protein
MAKRDRFDRFALWERTFRLTVPVTAPTDSLAKLLNYCDGLEIHVMQAIKDYFASQPSLGRVRENLELSIWKTGTGPRPNRYPFRPSPAARGEFHGSRPQPKGVPIHVSVRGRPRTRDAGD